tara:strand:+ start:646 stop:1005 length:360 start_codon:yes stop_codon:yes gene_type:complete
MSDVYKNRSVDLTTTDATIVYTVPTANAATVPPQKPVQAIVKSIRVCNDSGGAITITLINTDASVGGDIKIENAKSVASNTSYEVLTAPLILENSDVIKAQASGANALHVILSVLEITP